MLSGLPRQRYRGDEFGSKFGSGGAGQEEGEWLILSKGKSHMEVSKRATTRTSFQISEHATAVRLPVGRKKPCHRSRTLYKKMLMRHQTKERAEWRRQVIAPRSRVGLNVAARSQRTFLQWQFFPSQSSDGSCAACGHRTVACQTPRADLSPVCPGAYHHQTENRQNN